MTVYITQRSGYRDRQTGQFVEHDLRPAEKFGKLVTLLPSHPGDPALAPAPMVRHLRHALRDFTPDDYLLPMGSPAAICAAAILASRNSAGRVNVLVWDRRDHDYLVTNLEI